MDNIRIVLRFDLPTRTLYVWRDENGTITTGMTAWNIMMTKMSNLDSLISQHLISVEPGTEITEKVPADITLVELQADFPDHKLYVSHMCTGRHFTGLQLWENGGQRLVQLNNAVESGQLIIKPGENIPETSS